MLQPEDIIDGKYRITRLLGKGGMGSVYEGENLRIHRRVAIKVLHAAVAEDKTFVQRFEREAQAAGRIGSEHIVQVLDLGDLPSGDRFMVMEYLEGESLRARMKRLGPMMPEEIFPLVADLLDGLAEAHGAGIIHRDLKPDNVFLVNERKQQSDFVKILDFGVSKFKQLSTDSVTQTGVMLGTPHYMAPEQAKGEKHIDHRADLYSVGVILYRALTGQNPYQADNFNELMFKVVLEEAPRPTSLVPTLDGRAEAIVIKAMGRSADMRFRSADEFAGALREWLSDNGFEMSFQRMTRPGRHSSARGSGSMPGTDAARPTADVGAASVVDEPSLGTRMTSSTGVSAVSRLPRRGPLQFAAIGLVVAAGVFGVVAVLMRPEPREPARAGPGGSATAASSLGGQGHPEPGVATGGTTPGQMGSSSPSSTASGGVRIPPIPKDLPDEWTRPPVPSPSVTPPAGTTAPPGPTSAPATSSTAQRKWRTDI